LESIKEKDVMPPDSKASFADRFTAEAANLFRHMGKVVVIDDEIVGVLATVSKTMFINTAILNGKSITEAITTKVIWAPRTPTLRTPKSNSISCKSSDVGTMHVNDGCTALVLDGTENAGSTTGPVTISFEPLSDFAIENLSTSVVLNVWAPITPIALTSEATIINPVDKWALKVGADCTQQYQRSRITAQANFTIKTGGGVINTYEVPVTELIMGQLKSKNTAVVTVGDGFVQGVFATGTAVRTTTIFVENSAVQTANVGEQIISVAAISTETLAKPVDLEVYVIESLTMTEKISSPFSSGKKIPPLTVRQTTDLGQIDQRARVATYAVFSDGYRMPIIPADGVVLEPSAGVLALIDTDDINEKHTQVVAIGGGEGRVVGAKWKPAECSVGNADPLASGSGYSVVSVAKAIRAEITASFAGPFTADTDPLVLVGLTSNAKLTVKLVYPAVAGGTEYKKDVTGDTGTIFDMEGAKTNSFICQGADHSKCGNLAGAIVSMGATGGGSGTIVAKFSYTNLTASFTFEVISTKSVEVRLHPYPTYPISYVNTGAKSTAYTLDTLSRYNNPYRDTTDPIVRQQAIAHLYALATDDKAYALPLAGAKFATYYPGTDTADETTVSVSTSRVVSTIATENDIDGSGDDLVTEIGATLPKVNMPITKAKLVVTKKEVKMEQLEYPRLYSELTDTSSSKSFTGLLGYTDNVAVGARFSDGTHHPAVFTKSGPIFPGLIEIRSAEPAAAIAADSGVLTLKANALETVDISLLVRGQLGGENIKIGLACNLDPGVGDVDLGRNIGLPLGPNKVGDTFDVPLRINTGSDALGAFDLTITYDPTIIEAVKLPNGAFGKTGANWPGGIFEATVDPPGTLKLGGVPLAAAKLRGSGVEVAKVSFRAKKKGLTDISGIVNTMVSVVTSTSLSGNKIGAGTPRAFFAGNNAFFLDGNRRHSRAPTIVTSSHHQAIAVLRTEAAHRLRRANETKVEVDSSCSAPPCRTCLQTRDIGDTNGDCIFDISDVAYLTTYLAERASLPEPFITPLGKAISGTLITTQTYEMDANQDSRIDPADARYLSRINFGIQRFARDISVQPVQSKTSRGVLTINVTTFAKGNVIASDDRTTMFLDLEHHDASNAIKLQNTVAVVGEKSQTPKNPGLHGNVYEMERIGPVFDYGHSNVQPLLCREPSNTADVCQNFTYTTKHHWWNSKTDRCEVLEYELCPLTENDFKDHEACVATCSPTYLHTLELETPVVANDIGASFLIIAYDSQGQLVTGRDAFLTTAGQPKAFLTYGKWDDSTRNGQQQYTYTSALEIVVNADAGVSSAPSYPVTVVASNGYTPLIMFNNTLASAAAINDFDPEFAMLDWNVTASEDTYLGTTLVTMETTDQDVDLGYARTYNFVSGEVNASIISVAPLGGVCDGLLGGPISEAYVDTCGRWRIYGSPLALNPDDGDVTLAVGLDYETTKIHVAMVEVHDNSPPASRSGFARVVVSVTDYNDHPPLFFAAAEYAVMVSDTPAATALVRLSATDEDEAGNALLEFELALSDQLAKDPPPFRIDASGMLYTTRDITAADARLYTFGVRAYDLGTPSLSTETTVTVSMLTEESLFKLVLAIGLNEFAAVEGNVDAVAGEDVGRNKCIEALDRIFIGDVIVHEAVKGTAAIPSLKLTELTFYVIQPEDGTISTSKEVTVALMNNIADVVLRRECPIFEWEPEIPMQVEAHLQFFADSDCSVPLNGAGEIIGTNGYCLGDVAAGRSGRVFCGGTSASPSQLRVYDNGVCNTNNALLIAQTVDVAGENPSVLGDVCSEATPFGVDGPTTYIRASCHDPTMDYVEIVLNETIDGSGDEDFVDVPTKVKTMSPGSIGGFVAGVIIIWMIILMLVVRYRRQQKQLISAKLLVLANQGDVQFGTPEPMQKELGGFSGGEIDPVTGEMTLYKTGMDVDEGSIDAESALAASEARMPSMWGGQRANPMMMNGFGGGGHGMGGMDFDMDESEDDSEGLDSLGNLSDFEDADFEAFADSLLDDNLDDELFGYNRNPQGGAGGGALRGPPMSPTDSLSDFENGDSDDDVLDDLGIAISPVSGSHVRGQSFMGHAMGTLGRPQQAVRMQSSTSELYTNGGRGMMTSQTSTSSFDQAINAVRSGGINVVRNDANRMSSIDLDQEMYNGRDSISSLDLDEEIIVAQSTYEDVGQAWQTRQDNVTTAF
jgi:hypothetical protein